jgi:pimeloyl-ACP methyl ester carboxylesterase
MLRAGQGPPLVLFHGILGSEAVWRRVVPLVSAHHDTIVPTALGHRGGRHARERPSRIVHVVDDAERLLDELGVERAHLCGNSMGGWVSLELARRGRALSVCALSPAGCWIPGPAGVQRAAAALLATSRDTRRGRRVLPLLARSAAFRRWAMRLIAVHGDRLTPAEVLALADDLLACTIGEDLFAAQDALSPFSILPCPVTLAWSGRDRIFPPHTNGAYAREIVPGARFILLDDVGHVPMLDRPDLVARTVLDTTGASPPMTAATG